MPRHKGSRNKPKFIRVKISEINQVFNPEGEIDISIEYAFLFKKFDVINKEVANIENKKQNKIDYKIVNLE